jgi:hypothetical protein
MLTQLREGEYIMGILGGGSGFFRNNATILFFIILFLLLFWDNDFGFDCK